MDRTSFPPPGLVQWVTLLDQLHPEPHGLGALEIAEVEQCCLCTMIDFQSADFVVRTHDGRRFHLQGAIDADSGPDTVATSIVPMAPGQLLPFPPQDDDQPVEWSRETGVFNAELARLRQSLAASTRKRRGRWAGARGQAMVHDFQREFPHQIRLAFAQGWRNRHVTHALHHRRSLHDYRWWTEGEIDVWGFKDIEDVVTFEMWATSCGIDWEVPPGAQADDFGEPPAVYERPQGRRY